MSTQSGITGDQELLDHILNNNENVIIICRVDPNNSSIQLFQVIEEIDDLYYFIKTFEDCQHQPLYILIPHNLIDNNNNNDNIQSSNSPLLYDFVTFVPDEALTRNKMLYASSKLNLQRQIGNSKIHKSIMLTSLDELRFDSIVRDLQDVDMELLQKQDLEERELSEKLEKKNKIQQNSIVYANPNTTHASKLTFDIIDNNNYLDKFFSYSSNVTQDNFLKLVIDTQKEIIKVVQLESVASKSDVASYINEISYNIYRLDSDYFFIYACPSGSKVKDRMVYASSRQGCISHLISKYSNSSNNSFNEFIRVIEIGDSDDLDVSDFSPDHHHKQNDDMPLQDHIEPSSRRFNKPKGPPNRR